MKLATYLQDGRPGIGVVTGDDRLLPVADWVRQTPVTQAVTLRCAAAGIEPAAGGMLRLLQAGPPALAALALHVQAMREAGHAAMIPLDAVTLLAPVPRPGKIVAIGRNYADHAKETGVAPFEKPRIIAKLPSSVAAPGTAIPCPPDVTKLDFEAELAVVIGVHARHIEAHEAPSVIAGYTVLNDMSAREFQFDVSPPQTTFAKSHDGFAPMGPWLVTRDEVPDPQALTVEAWINGERMQHGHTADMLFPVNTLIAYLSRFMTLEPGDVVATGTPAGSGAFRDPPRYLRAGDRLRLSVSGVGVLEHGIA
ncbi:fumarylacetoacetate hydrolase family protein [Cupriavidus sp. 2TAF22]|uniref:fumarylacetoacetate hydrolase family protein n=1 Tax=unclassified Cupriavidus TaxID=2640874 RepID=UPI003F92B263